MKCSIKKCLIGFCLTFLLYCLPRNLISQISFAPYKAITTGSWPQVVAIGDVNNDGLNDVVLGTTSYNDPSHDYKIFVFIQDNAGNLKSPVLYSYPAHYFITCISIGDIDNDGLNDIVIGYGDSIGIFKQNTSGKLNACKGYYSGNSVNALNTGDLNKDGLIDIAVFSSGNARIKVFYQKMGGFDTITFPAVTGTGRDQVEIADMNNDGLNDVVLLSGQAAFGGVIHVFTQNPLGLLNNFVTYQPNYSSAFTDLNGLALGDLNNDGKSDVAVTINSNSGQIVIWLQDTLAKTLSTSFQIVSYDIPEPIRIADLGCTKRNQMIVAHGGWMTVSVFDQDNNGNYGNYLKFSIPYASHYDPQGMAIGDINNDGQKDVVLADYNSGLVILVNTTASSSTKIPLLVTSKDTSICIGNSAQLTVSGPGIFNWSPSSSLNSATGSSVVALPTATTTYSVTTLTTCGIDSGSFTLNVKSLPVLSIIPANPSVCPGSSITLSAYGANSYYWLPSSGTSSSIIVSPFIATDYKVIGTSLGGCIDSTTITVEIQSKPIAEINGDTIVCPGSNTLLTSSGGDSYLWNNGSTATNISVNPGIITNYSVIAFANGCASIPDTITIFMKPLPAIYAGQDVIIVFGKSTNLSATGKGIFNWLPAEGLSCTNCQFPIANPELTTTYCVVVSDTNICPNTDCVTVEVLCGDFFIPTAFSPNADGQNDVLFVRGLCIQSIDFLVFNRWGEKVFETTTISKGWDGTFKGQACVGAAYTYYLNAIMLDGSTVSKQGYVLLVR